MLPTVSKLPHSWPSCKAAMTGPVCLCCPHCPSCHRAAQAAKQPWLTQPAQAAHIVKAATELRTCWPSRLVLLLLLLPWPSTKTTKHVSRGVSNQHAIVQVLLTTIRRPTRILNPLPPPPSILAQTGAFLLLVHTSVPLPPLCTDRWSPYPPHYCPLPPVAAVQPSPRHHERLLLLLHHLHQLPAQLAGFVRGEMVARTAAWFSASAHARRGAEGDTVARLGAPAHLPGLHRLPHVPEAHLGGEECQGVPQLHSRQVIQIRDIRGG